MAIVSLNVNEVVGIIYGNFYLKTSDIYKLHDIELNDKDTYLLVFGPLNQHALDCFRKNNKFKILHESITACNRNYPKCGPRNTLFIFEKGEENVS